MRLAVLGASSPTGRLVVAASIREGFDVRALVRSGRPGGPAGALPAREGLEVVDGDATDPDAVARVCDGAAAAVCLVGPVRGSPPDLCQRTAQALVVARVPRIVLVTGAMIGRPPEHAHGIYRLAPTFLGALRDDRRAAEAIVREGASRWCIVRPPRLGDGPTERWVMVGPEIEVGTMDAIPRIDLAEVLVEAARGRWDGLGVAARTAHRDERHEALRVPLGVDRGTERPPSRRSR